MYNSSLLHAPRLYGAGGVYCSFFALVFAVWTNIYNARAFWLVSWLLLCPLQFRLASTMSNQQVSSGSISEQATECVPNPARPDGRAIHYGDFSRQRSSSPPFVGVRNPARPGTECIPNPARPDGRAIHYGDFSRQRSSSPPFVGVRNPARPGGGAIDYGSFGCKSRSRTPPPSDRTNRLIGG